MAPPRTERASCPLAPGRKPAPTEEWTFLMAQTRVRGKHECGKDRCTEAAPDRMALIDQWLVDKTTNIELYIDDVAGDGWMLLATSRVPTTEHVATLFHAGGVTRATVWHGTGALQTDLWRDTQRCKAIAAIAFWHAESRDAAA